jgi:transcriptional regulator with AAA-type ATPase domain
MNETDLTLPDFTAWNAKRVGFKHNWFDHLWLIVRAAKNGDPVPESLRRWSNEYGNLLEWLHGATEALSPHQVLSLPAFEGWPDELRDECRAWLRARFQQAFPEVEALVQTCGERLAELDRELQPILQGTQLELSDAKRSTLEDLFQKTAACLRELPQGVVWPEPRADDGLACILVIDDLLGRGTSRESAGPSIGEKAARELGEIRRSFCAHFRLVDAGAGARESLPARPLARAFFCSGQRWDPEREVFVNDTEVVRRAVAQGPWGAGAASQWALVIVDVLFNTGRPEEHGRGPDDSPFGVDEILPLIRREFPTLPAIALTTEATGDIIKRVHRLRFPYLKRTDITDETLLYHVVKAGRITPAQLRAALDVQDDLIAEDPSVMDVLFEAWREARDENGRTILLTGPSGAGKERFAQFMHATSGRKGQFVSVNCAELEKGLGAGELFGHYEGAFTDATEDAEGHFHKADGGTLFLDEFADLEGPVQNMLLRALQAERASEVVIKPVGQPKKSSKSVGQPKKAIEELRTKLDVRVICATSQDLSSLREDLLYRIPTHIHIPPLNERRGDILPLAEHFLSSPRHQDAPGLQLDEAARDFLQSGDFSGNVRTLANVIRRSAQGKGKINVITRADVEGAYAAEQGKFRAQRSPKGASAVTSKPPAGLGPEPASEPRPPATPFDAAATILGWVESGVDWNTLRKADIEALDTALRGNVWEVFAALVEWAMFRSPDAPALAEYLTGGKGQGRAPTDLVKRLVNLDRKISDRLASSPYIPENERLADIIRSGGDEREKRSASTRPRKSRQS